MNFGFNSNVRSAAGVFHVQTEDRGADHPFIDTVVYQGGRVVHKRSISYEDLLAKAGEPAAFADLLHARLSEQHKDVIAQVESGTLNAAPAVSAVPVRGAAPAAAHLEEMALVVELTNPTSWLASGGITLQVRISVEQIAAGGAEVEAFLESSTGRSKPCRGTADGHGCVELKFPMPASLGENPALVIRATLDDDRGELRFRLKPSKTGPVPSVPVA